MNAAERIAEEVAKAEYNRLVALGMKDEAASRWADREYGRALFNELRNAAIGFPSVDSQIRFNVNG
jgi:hypothetical protein